MAAGCGRPRPRRRQRCAKSVAAARCAGSLAQQAFPAASSAGAILADSAAIFQEQPAPLRQSSSLGQRSLARPALLRQKSLRGRQTETARQALHSRGAFAGSGRRPRWGRLAQARCRRRRSSSEWLFSAWRSARGALGACRQLFPRRRRTRPRCLSGRWRSPGH